MLGECFGHLPGKIHRTCNIIFIYVKSHLSLNLFFSCFVFLFSSISVKRVNSETPKIPPKTREIGGGSKPRQSGFLVLGDISHQNFRILGPPPSLVCWVGVSGTSRAKFIELEISNLIRKMTLYSYFVFSVFCFVLIYN